MGERGIVLLSDDAGATWRQASSVPQSVTLTAVRFVSTKEGWAAGHLGVILHTQDGGEHWTRQLEGTAAAGLALYAARKLPPGHERSKAEDNATLLVSDGPDKPFLDLWVALPGEVTAVGAFGVAVRSHDGGKTWESAIESFDDPKGLHLYRMVRATEASYLVGEQGMILASRDGSRFEPMDSVYNGSLFGRPWQREVELCSHSDFGEPWACASTRRQLDGARSGPIRKRA